MRHQMSFTRTYETKAMGLSDEDKMEAVATNRLHYFHYFEPNYDSKRQNWSRHYAYNWSCASTSACRREYITPAA